MSEAESGRKRGRARVYDAQATRETILNAAEALFAAHGYHGTSVDAIASRAGYNKSLLFQYFGDKLGLYTQVLRRIDADMGELLARMFLPLVQDETLASDAERFRNVLTRACGALFDYLVEHPQVMRLFNWEQAEGWQTFTRIAAQFEPDHLAQLEALFEKARAAGLVRANLDLVVMIMLIEQLCWSSPATLPLYHMLLAGRDNASAMTLSRIREQVVAFLVAGIMGGAVTS